jgi:hypothetical protein
MLAMYFGQKARWLAIFSAVLVVRTGDAGPVVRDIPAPQGTILSGGNVHLDFADPQFGFETANLDRLDEVVWTGGSGELATTNFVSEFGENELSTDPEDFFGESLGVPLSPSGRGDAPFIIDNGYASVASRKTATTLTTTTTGKDFKGDPTNVPIASTDYTVYPAGDPNQNEFRMSRTINFTSATPIYPSPGVRFYIPYVSNDFFIVLYPSTGGSIKEVDSSQCILVCEVTDWTGQWFADDADGDGGMLVIRDASSLAPAQLVIAFEEETSENLTAIALLQPTNGFKAPVTETEWVCFYDPSTWSFEDQQAGNLPQGCAQKNQAAPDTTPDAFSFTAVTGVAPSSTQTSNIVTITGINAAAAIAVSGGVYSINGGAYTSAAGSVNQGDTVALQGIAATTYATATSVLLTVGGVSGAFSITTQSAPSAPVVTLNASSSSLTAGQTTLLTWATSNATACAASGAWQGTEPTSGTATAAPTSAGMSIYTLTCTGPGGSAVAAVNVSVSAEAVAMVSGRVGGGGALGFKSLCVLLILVLVARTRSSNRPLVMSAAVAFGAWMMFGIGASPALAEEQVNSASPYMGIRAGISDYQFSPADLESRLGAAGSDLDSATISKRQFGGMLYGGVPIYRSLMLELSYAQLGQFPLSTKTTSADNAALAQRILGQLAPAGHGVTAGFALPLQFGSVFGIEPRLSALYYQSKQVVALGTTEYRNDLRGVGLDAEFSATFHIAAPFYAGVGLDCFHMTQSCNVLVYTAQLEYRFGKR